MSWYPSEAWRDSYDAWKLRSPDDEYYMLHPGAYCEPEENEEPEFLDIDFDDLLFLMPLGDLL